MAGKDWMEGWRRGQTRNAGAERLAKRAGEEGCLHGATPTGALGTRAAPPQGHQLFQNRCFLCTPPTPLVKHTKPHFFSGLERGKYFSLRYLLNPPGVWAPRRFDKQPRTRGARDKILFNYKIQSQFACGGEAWAGGWTWSVQTAIEKLGSNLD